MNERKTKPKQSKLLGSRRVLLGALFGFISDKYIIQDSEGHKQITAHPLPVESTGRIISKKGNILETPCGFLSDRYARSSFGLRCIAFP